MDCSRSSGLSSGVQKPGECDHAVPFAGHEGRDLPEDTEHAGSLNHAI